MLLLGRVLFYAGFLGLAFQMFEHWLDLVEWPITAEESMLNAMMWWTGCAIVAGAGLIIKKKNGDED